MTDWETINDPVFLAAVKTTGFASKRIHLPEYLRDRRFPPEFSNMDQGGISIAGDGQSMEVYWDPFDWGNVKDSEGIHYANLYFIAPIRGEYFTWAIEKLRRPGEAGGTKSINTGDWTEYSDVMDIIFDGKINSPVVNRDHSAESYRPPLDALCGFWVGGWPRGTDRRSDVLPWRYKTLTRGGATETEGGGGGEMGRLSPLTVYVDLEALAAALIKGSQ